MKSTIKSIYLKFICVLLTSNFISCSKNASNIKFIEKQLKIDLDDKYQIVHKGENQSWRKDVIAVHVKIKIEKSHIDTILDQIKNSKYFNLKIGCCLDNPIYRKDKKLVDEFYKYYFARIANSIKLKELPYGQYQIEYLSYAKDLIEGNWRQLDSNHFVFEEIYDNTGAVFKSATFNRDTGILQFDAWPSP